jgi:signal transduction histidine kinase/CheY-like chemotaxis protein
VTDLGQPDLARRVADLERLLKAVLVGDIEPLFVAARAEPAVQAIVEEVLREGLADKIAVIEHLPCGVVVYDERGGLLFANRAAGLLSPWSGDARALPGVSMELAPIEPATGRRFLADELPVARALRGETVEGFECVLRRPGPGDDVALRLSAVPRVDVAGTVTGAICTFIDITERSRLEQELLQADRMACVGTLASGMAHEINNPLTYVVANVVFAADEVPALVRSLPSAGVTLGPRVAEIGRALNDAREGAERIRRVVGELKSFAQAEDDARVAIDVRGPLEAACLVAESEIRHRAKLIKQLTEVPRVLASEGRLRQLFLNLLMNAAQSIDERPAESHEIRVSTGVSRTGEVLVLVSDTGAGLDPASIPRVFDPFFSLRPTSVSTGFGLATCQSIAVAHGGTLTVDSVIGRGTEFRLSLPADLSPAAAVIDHATPRRGRILVVDDEIAVVDSIRRVLGRLHDVTVAFEGAEAVELIGREPPFDLILCDVMMPEMGGFEVHARLAEIKPEALPRIVFMTGGAFTPRARAFLESVPNARLSKPFDLGELRAFVAGHLAHLDAKGG